MKSWYADGNHLRPVLLHRITQKAGRGQGGAIRAQQSASDQARVRLLTIEEEGSREVRILTPYPPIDPHKMYITLSLETIENRCPAL